MKKSDHIEKYCPVAKTLGVLEDSWSFLIMRNALHGTTRFNDFQQQLGVTRHLLSARLKRFLDEGVMEKKPDPSGAGGHAYVLTEKGLDLAPAITMLAVWGAKWGLDGEEPPILYRHKDCGQIAVPVVSCSECGGELTMESVTLTGSSTLQKKIKGASDEEAGQMLGYPPPLEHV